MTVAFTCDDTTYTIPMDAKGAPVFTKVWTAKVDYCDGYGSDDKIARSTPTLTAVEAAVDRLLGHEEYDSTLADIYVVCAMVDPGSDYAGTDEMAVTDTREIKAALALCPKHPRASRWKLVIAGRIFEDGTYLVGQQAKPGDYVKPGTYVIQLGPDDGTIHDCYWERTNKSGNIIANNFILSAKRVQVTIRSGDYSFMSRDCGTWRPL
ncbi:hypothetical protein [Catellatospora vulcania]|uniref:hypothetical protein n=1 Tax=Catellatospora vulcania TaxID=1460450 RepID=UPI0012D3E919|nr:hypothetical protein [Catellatospora vulcania]